MFGDKFDAFKKIKLGTNEEKMVARKFLVEKNLGLVRSIANKKLAKASSRDKSVEFSDLVSEGVFGLMKAIEAFDYSRGIAFSTFAYKHINGEINRFLENNGHIRVTVELRNLYNKYKKMIKEAEKTDKEITDEEIMKGLGIGQSTFDRLVESIPIIEGRVVRDVSSFGGGDDSSGEENPWDFAEDNRPSPEDDAMQRSEDRWLETLVESSLNNDEKNIITGRFGLDGGDEKTLEEIADERGITREAIRQKEAKALSKLRGAAPNHRPNESSFVIPDGPAKPIIESVCAEMGVKLGDIFGTDRSHDLSRARARICFEIKEQLNWTAKEIANFLDVKVGLVNNWIHKEKVRRRGTMGDT
jgi:RNA polymerase primary sigma factor